MEIIKVTNKGPIMDTTEKYHIYVANQNGIQLNGTHTHNRNPIFNTLCKHL
jgi:filamentous hemagglutinin family protein